MTERLDRIEAQQEANTANIADLITLSGNVLRAAELNTASVSELRTKIDESNQRFEVLRQEAIADRQRSDQRFEESNRRFDAQISEIRAQGEQIRALLSALATTNGRVDGLEQAS